METRSDSVSSPMSSFEFLLAAAITLGVLTILLRNDPGGLSNDPDSYMRLARFREGYGIFHGGFVPRDNAPYGTVLPWTMPMDGVLAFFYAIGRAFSDQGGALYFAARVASPFLCATIGPLIFFGLRPFFSLRARVVMAGMAAISPGLVGYSVPGQADHHAMEVWSSVLFAVVLIRYLFLDWPRYWQAAVAGVAAAGALWTSLEGFIIVGTGLSALVLHRCMVESPRADRTWAGDLVLAGAFALAMTTAWLVDPPYEGLWAPKTDRLSIVYVSFSWLFAANLIGFGIYLSKAASFSRPRNLVVAALLGGAAFLCWIAVEPDVLKGPFGQVDQSLSLVFFADQDIEMLPLWRLTMWTVPHLACLILIWIAIAVLIAKTSGPQRRLWIACAVLMIPVSLIGIRFVRAMYYAEVFGSIPLGLVLAQRTRRYSKKFMEFSAIALSAVVMLGVYSATTLLWHGLRPPHQSQAAAANVCRTGTKSLSEAIAPIENRDAIVMTELNYAPRVLYLSPHLRTVAGPFHRNTEGIRDVFAFFNAHSDDDARAIVYKRGIKYVLICDTGAGAPGAFFSFGDRILRDTPAWLEPLGPRSPAPGFRLYRVRSGSGLRNNLWQRPTGPRILRALGTADGMRLREQAGFTAGRPKEHRETPLEPSNISGADQGVIGTRRGLLRRLGEWHQTLIYPGETSGIAVNI